MGGTSRISFNSSLFFIKIPARDISLPWFSIISSCPYSKRPKTNQFVLKMSFCIQIISIIQEFFCEKSKDMHFLKGNLQTTKDGYSSCRERRKRSNYMIETLDSRREARNKQILGKIRYPIGSPPLIHQTETSDWKRQIDLDREISRRSNLVYISDDCEKLNEKVVHVTTYIPCRSKVPIWGHWKRWEGYPLRDEEEEGGSILSTIYTLPFLNLSG